MSGKEDLVSQSESVEMAELKVAGEATVTELVEVFVEPGSEPLEVGGGLRSSGEIASGVTYAKEAVDGEDMREPQTLISEDDFRAPRGADPEEEEGGEGEGSVARDSALDEADLEPSERAAKDNSIEAEGADRNPSQSGRRLNNSLPIEQILTSELVEAARYASLPLKERLCGRLFVDIIDRRERYLFDWSEQIRSAIGSSGSDSQAAPDAPASGEAVVRTAVGEPKVGIVGSDQVPSVNITDDDCIIELHSAAFRGILDGRLNPQIAMLSHRVKVRGKHAMAMYFFNLLRPSAI